VAVVRDAKVDRPATRRYAVVLLDAMADLLNTVRYGTLLNPVPRRTN